MAKPTDLLNDILTELRGLRNDINPRINNRNPPVKPKTSTNGEPAKQNSSRQLLNKIAANPLPTTICWYHRKHGIATNPNNCPGLPDCHWDQVAEMNKMQATINRYKNSTTPAQSRLKKAKLATQQPIPSNIVSPIPIEQPKLSPTPRRSYTPATPPSTDWSTQIDNEIDQMDTTTVEPLEQQLADLSD